MHRSIAFSLLLLAALIVSACGPQVAPPSGETPGAGTPPEDVVEDAVNATVSAILAETQRADEATQEAESIGTAINATLTAVNQQTAVIQTATALAIGFAATATPSPSPTVPSPTPSSTPTTNPDQGIFTPVPPPPCTIRQDWPAYTALPGDSLALVAARTGTSVEVLIQANCLPNANQLEVGQQLRVPRLPAYIAAFTTSTSAVEAISLAMREGMVSVSWQVGDRPAGTNLVFEQIMPSGAVYNVELPRHFTEVPSSGTGALAPLLPRGDTTQLRLRLRLITSDNRTLDSRELTVPVVNSPQGSAFTVAEAGRCFDAPYQPSSNLTVGWRGAVSSNLPFKGLPVTSVSGFGGDVLGLLPSGATFVVTGGPFCFSTSLPVASSTHAWRMWKVRAENGSLEGWVIEYGLSGIRTRNNIVALQQTTVYTGAACYQSPFPLDRGLTLGGQARALIPLSLWDAPGPDANSTNLNIGANGTVTLLEGPYCFRREPAYPVASPGWRQWRVRIDSTGSEGWLYEYSSESPYLEPAGGSSTDVEIVTFSVTPQNPTIGDNLTVSWEVTGVNNVSITWRHDRIEQGAQPINGDGSLLPPTGQQTFDPPDILGTLTLTLTVPGITAQYLEVPIACQNTWMSSSSLLDMICPTSAPQATQAAYQVFEYGTMIWQNNTVWVLYNTNSAGKVFPDTWNGEDITFGQTTPDGRYLPVRGFGRVWVDNTDVRQSLGWGTSPEQGYTAQFQQAPGISGGMAYLITLPDGRQLALRQTGSDLYWLPIN